MVIVRRYSDSVSITYYRMYTQTSSSSSSSSSLRWKYQFEEINDHVLIDNANDRDDDWSSVPCNCYERLRNKDDQC